MFANIRTICVCVFFFYYSYICKVINVLVQSEGCVRKKKKKMEKNIFTNKSTLHGVFEFEFYDVNIKVNYLRQYKRICKFESCACIIVKVISICIPKLKKIAT